jgi:hypothetical protein
MRIIPSTISVGLSACNTARQIGSGLTDGFALELYSEELKAYLSLKSVEVLGNVSASGLPEAQREEDHLHASQRRRDAVEYIVIAEGRAGLDGMV